MNSQNPLLKQVQLSANLESTAELHEKLVGMRRDLLSLLATVDDLLGEPKAVPHRSNGRKGHRHPAR